MSGPQHIGELIGGPDFIARLADAWDGKGANVLAPGGDEHRALLELARLPTPLFRARWDELRPQERWALMLAARRAIEFGRQCAWMFGEGQGARF